MSIRNDHVSAAAVIGPKGSRAGRLAAASFVAGLALVFSIFVAACYRNMPSGDDFIAIFKPALAAHEQGWSAVNVREVFAQHFSHRIAPVRAMAMAQVLLFGKLNFAAFMWVGLFSWLAIFVLLAWQAGFTRSSAVMVFLALVWFQPQAAPNCLVAMQAASNLPVILLALAAFAFRAGSGDGRWVSAWFAGLLALMTTGNGLLVLLILMLWDGYEQQWRRLLAGVLILACALVLYFAGFSNPESQRYASNWSDLAGNLLVMTGAVANVGRMPLSAVLLAGVSLGAVAAVVLFSALRRGEKFLGAVLLFVGGSIAMASVARAGWGNEYMLQPRYMVYPIMLLSVCGAYFVALGRRPAVSAGMILFGLMAAALSWWHYAPLAVSNARSVTAEVLSWQLGYPSFRFAGDKEENMAGVTEALDLLRKAENAGIFTLQDTGLVRGAIVAQEANFEAVGEWNDAAAGYLIQVPPAIESADYILFESAEWQQVAFRPLPRIALGRSLRGKPQGQHLYIAATPLSHTADQLPGVARNFDVLPQE
jgi:hypothetical protein